MSRLAFIAALALAVPARAEERVIAIVPLGPVDLALVKVAARAIEERVVATVRIEAARELPKEAWYAPRRRWRAEKLLAALEKERPAGAWKTVGITAAEISTTKGQVLDGRVGGLGDVGGPTCVVSTWITDRQSRTNEILHRRMADEVIHELGHTLGLAHCDGAGCVMRDARGRLLETPGSSTGRFCDRCRRALSGFRSPVLRP